MFSFLTKFLDYNKKEITRLQKIVNEINAFEEEARELKDIDFPKETARLKELIQSGDKTLDEVLPWSYALVRESARRTLNQRHFDVQLLASIALHEGKVIEQKTGEGKTLTATASLYLNALTGKGVHLVTVNDYLARRDAGWMGSIFHFLGVSTSAIISGNSYIYDPKFLDADTFDDRLSHLRPASRKEAYEADVTYGINSEYGFDYLRDNMAHAPHALVQRGFHYAIVDEADSVLIDEARTPHIISAPVEEDTSKYYGYAQMVKQLGEGDFIIDEKLRTAHLTEEGVQHIEKILGVQNIYEKDFDTLYHIEAALKAKTLFKLDKDYIVQGDEVVIVDEFTGRLLEGRRFSEGLHQAIEAKESVSIKRESRTLATVSLQNYFRGYTKLAGMTGTAATEAEEFSKIYKADVLVVPTHRAMSRIDHADMIYKTEKAKFNAVVVDIAEQYKKGRPVLVGTTSIEKNEYISRLLKEKGIPHELLNAKNHEREAFIIAQAGKKNAITVATNMAGRGVDIVMGGDIQRSNYKSEKEYEKAAKQWEKEHEEVLSLGGLYVIGTERHESRRIDNQLRGRSGRQGDAGETRFYVSLEDDVMRIFGGDQISKLMTFLNFPEDQPLSHPMVSRAIEQAQVKVEGHNFDIRKHLVEYDDVLNKQREIVYTLRRKMLMLPEENPENFKKTFFELVGEQVRQLSASYFSLRQNDDVETGTFAEDISLLLNIPSKEVMKSLSESEEQEFEEFILKKTEALFKKREKEIGQDIWYQVIRSLFLPTFDQFWTVHLTAIDDLREGVRLRAHAQLDPLVEYKNEAFIMFEKLISDIQFESIRRVMKVEIKQETAPQEVIEAAEKKPQKMEFSSAAALNPFKPEETKQSKIKKDSAPPVQTDKNKKIGRNDPCWCGSGKKYKKCHYPN